MSASSDISEFLEAKVKDLVDDIEHIQHLSEGLHELKKNDKITVGQLKEVNDIQKIKRAKWRSSSLRGCRGSYSRRT
jgi:FtsZ-binding cell division protein ZapB